MNIYEGINKIANDTAELVKAGVEEFDLTIEEQMPTYATVKVEINGKTFTLVGEFTLK